MAEEKEKRVFVGFYVEAEIKAQLQEAAELEAMSLSALLGLLVRAYVRTKKLPGAA